MCILNYDTLHSAKITIANELHYLSLDLATGIVGLRSMIHLR